MAAGSTKIIIAALIGNALIAVTKFFAGAITGSSAMFSEGVHSLVDTGNQILLLYGLRRANLPADEQFPFGHGKEVYFWSFVVAILIFAVGAGVSIYEGIHGLIDPQPMEHVLVNYIVLGIAIVIEFAAWYFAFKGFKSVKGNLGYIEAVQQGKDPSMFVVLFEDTAALLGLLVALIGISLGQTTANPVYDSIAAVIIGLILAATAVWLAYETKSLLIGESADKKLVAGIRALAASAECINHVNEVLTLHMGPEFILVTLSVDFKNDTRAEEIEHTIARMDRAIKKEYTRVKKVFVEAEARSALAGQETI